MQNLSVYISPEQWMRHVFSAQSAIDGGIVRRKIRDIERFVGRDAFLDEMRRRGFSVVENAGQYVIFCNRQPVKRVL